MADTLLSLVLSKTKTATCWSAQAEGPMAVGSLEVFVDGEGVDRALVRVVSITLRRFCDVEADFAFAEGEGDRSLQDWRKGHRNFFERNGGFTLEMELWCERFELVRAL
jgi:uncharacterized protein YhfF